MQEIGAKTAACETTTVKAKVVPKAKTRASPKAVTIPKARTEEIKENRLELKLKLEAAKVQRSQLEAEKKQPKKARARQNESEQLKDACSTKCHGNFSTLVSVLQRRPGPSARTGVAGVGGLGPPQV